MSQAPASRRAAVSAAAFAVAMALSSVGIAGADWLVTKDGARVETKGPWRVEGKRVLFTTLATGTLASMRLADVDLPASERATAEAKAAAEAAAAAKAKPEAAKKPVKSFSDKDFGHSEPVPLGEEAAGEGADAAPQAPVSTTVEVANWTPEQRVESKQLVVRGTLRNNGEDVATAIGVSVRLIDQQGLLINTQEAILATKALRPGQTTSFEVTFTDVVTYGSVAFEVRSVPLLTRPKPEEETPPPASTSS